MVCAACAALSGCIDKEKSPAERSSAAATAASPAAAPAKAKPPAKWSGPLGVEMGLSVAEIGAAGVELTPIEGVPLLFRSDSAPAPSSSFNDYLYLISEADGLCRITAWTPERSANDFGEQLVSAFDELESALTEKYGKPRTFKFVQRGSIWNESRHFMMGLLKEERTHAAAWDGSGGGSLPENVGAITLNVTAFTPSTGAVKLIYEFKNADSCLKAAKQQKHSSL